MKRSFLGLVVMVPAILAVTAPAPMLHAADVVTTMPSVDAQPIPFERETLPNGLRVIYAPMSNAPVVHVRVLYHVGSKDEAADRQGFAHMFEHMMFRGSEHVPSERHMKLIQSVGGVSNAFTSFDQTTYVNTVPNNQLQMALWLEADRMASFKVGDNVLATERNVVKEEWRLRYANQPYGAMFKDLFALAFKVHNYKWQAIGDMDQLAQAVTPELQDFHDRYYTPNNACLIVAGQFDVAQAKAWVRDYYGWIKPGPAIIRVSRPEPAQTDGPRELVVRKAGVPYTRVYVAYKSPPYRDDDHLALDMLTVILGNGRSSRLYRSLVADDPIASTVSMGNYQLEDPSAIIGSLYVLPDKDPAEAIARFRAVVNQVATDGVTQDELDKARTQSRVSIVASRVDAESVATTLGDEEVFGGDAARANQYFSRLDKLTVADLKRVAGEYLNDKGLSVVQYRPADEATSKPAADATPAPATVPSKTEAEVNAEHPLPTTAKVARLMPEFPKAYPTTAPFSADALAASFNKGTTQTIRGVQVITMTDARLPVVSVQLVVRGGSDAAMPEKAGVAGLASAMLSRGAGGVSAAALAEQSESRGVDVSVDDDGDVTRLKTFSTVDQLDFAIDRLKLYLERPDFPPAEFEKLKRQAQQGLRGALSDPGKVADIELDKSMYGERHPLGKTSTPQTLASITLDDVRQYYETTYRPENAILVFAGAIEPARANALAEKLLDGWKVGVPPTADYAESASRERRITLVDNPDGQQAVIRLGTRAYTLKDEERFAGSVFGQVLSSGIDSRLNLVLRAEKGLTYGAYGYFRPMRNGGAFELSIETKPESVDDAITSTFEVLDKMKKNDIEDEELTTAQQRTAGLLVLDTQTIQDQAKRRTDTVLNGYPVDYYDLYAKRIGEVTKAQVRDVANRYLKDDRTDIVVVGPAALVEPQLTKFGVVTTVPMPLAATTQSAR